MGQVMSADAGDSSRTHGPADVSSDMFFQSCIQSNVVWMSAHSQTPPGSGGPVPLEGISETMSSRCLHTPRHPQGVGDQLLQRESPEQCCPDICTLPDTPREWGTSSPGRNLWNNVVRTSAHSQTPPGSGGPVALEGISRTMSFGRLHTPRHLQGVGDQLLQRESPEQCHPDICTLPDTSREWGTSCSRGNLWSNVIWTSAHSQTPPGSGGPVAPEGISGAMSSGHLHTPRHLQGVGEQFLQKESPEGISRTMSSRHLHTPRHLQGVWDQFLQTTPPEN